MHIFDHKCMFKYVFQIQKVWFLYFIVRILYKISLNILKQYLKFSVEILSKNVL